MKPLGISQKQLAEHLFCDYKVINRIVNNHTAISPSMAIRLSMAFNTTPDFWLNAQIAQDIWRYQKDAPKISSIVEKAA